MRSVSFSLIKLASRAATAALTLIAAGTLTACGDGTTVPSPPTAPTVNSVEVTPSSAMLVSLGDTVQLTATARDASGNAISDKTFAWWSSDENVATVSVSGLVTAVANGTTTVAASTEGVEGSASITVQQQAHSTGVTPGGASISGVGATLAFTVKVLDANGHVIPGLPTTPVNWTSLNANVATIDASTGEATALASGQVTIGAEVQGEVGYALLTVSVPGLGPIASWTVDVPQVFPLADLWGTSSSDVYAVGEEGTILHYDGTEWSAMTSGTDHNLNGVWGTSSSNVYAVAGGGMILHYNGTEWSEMTSGTSQYLGAVWGSSSTDVYAVGTGGTILHYDGTGRGARTGGV